MLMVFSLLSERRRPRCVVSDNSDIVFSLRSNENDFLEYDFGLFSYLSKGSTISRTNPGPLKHPKPSQNGHQTFPCLTYKQRTVSTVSLAAFYLVRDGFIVKCPAVFVFYV